MSEPTQSVPWGPFDVERSLGGGGMGLLFAGMRRSDHRRVAIKVMSGELAQRDRFRRAFRREVQAMARMDHPGIASVLDFGQVDDDTAEEFGQEVVAGSPWLAMEYIDGEGLHQWSLDWNWQRLKALLLGLLDALGHAHALGIVHRDLKPANVLVVEDGDGEFSPVIVDFGIAHVGRPADAETAGRTTGTPAYMSPEQVMGRWRDQGPWTDLYGLGCLCWRIACGSPPFQEDESEATMAAHLNESLPGFEPSFAVPAGFEKWLRRLLDKPRHRRFNRCADAAFDLREIPDAPENLVEGSRAEAPEGPDPFLPTLEETVPTPSESGFAIRMPADVIGSEQVLDEPVRRPPLPESWRPEEGERTDRERRRAELSLFGLRRVPVVDRDSVRDELWRGMHESVEDDALRVVLLRGRSGTGKSRLAEWLTYRGHEAGAVTILKTTHDLFTSRRAGLGTLVSNLFCLDGLDWQETYDRIRTQYEAMAFPAAAIIHDTRALADLVSVEGTRRGEVPPGERHRILTRMLDHLASRRPVLMWLDDVQWGPETIAFVRHLMNERVTRRTMIMMTGRFETSGVEPRVGEILSEIRHSELFREIELGSLALEDMERLVSRLAPVSSGLAEAIARRADGEPLFAVQMLSDFVERDLLEPTAGSSEMELPPGTELPVSLTELWNRRVARICERFEADVASEQSFALEQAAAFGRQFDEREWLEACEIGGFKPHEKLMPAMLKSGFVRRLEAGWMFVHDSLVESLAAAARRGGRYTEHHQRCASVISEMYRERQRATSARRAEHLIEAGDYEAALDPLETAVDYVTVVGDFRRAMRLVGRRQEVVDMSGFAEDSRHAIRNRWLRAGVLALRGATVEAREIGEDVLEVARREEWTKEIAGASMILANVVRGEGRLEESLQHFRRGRRGWSEIDEVRGVAKSLYGEAFVYFRRGHFQKAREHFEESLEQAEQVGDRAMKARCLACIGLMWIHEGEPERGRETTQRGLRVAREIGGKEQEAICWGNLGQLARLEGNWQGAADCYENAFELYRMAGARAQHAAELNLVLAAIESGRFDEARTRLERLEHALEAAGLSPRLCSVAIARACCAAHDENWQELDECLERAEALHAQNEDVVEDEAHLAETAAEIAASAEHLEAAVRALEFARHQWTELGRDERVSRVEKVLDELTSN